MEHRSLLPSALDSPEADRLRGASLSFLDLPLLNRNTIITFQETEIIFKWTINFLSGPFLKSLLNLLPYGFCFLFGVFGYKGCGILALFGFFGHRDVGS